MNLRLVCNFLGNKTLFNILFTYLDILDIFAKFSSDKYSDTIGNIHSA